MLRLLISRDMSPSLSCGTSAQAGSPPQVMMAAAMFFLFFSWSAACTPRRSQALCMLLRSPAGQTESLRVIQPISTAFRRTVSAPRPRSRLRPHGVPVMQSAGPAPSRHPRFACHSDLYVAILSAEPSLFFLFILHVSRLGSRRPCPYLLTSGSSPGQGRTLRTPWAGCRRPRAA